MPRVQRVRPAMFLLSKWSVFRRRECADYGADDVETDITLIGGGGDEHLPSKISQFDKSLPKSVIFCFENPVCLVSIIRAKHYQGVFFPQRRACVRADEWLHVKR